MYDDTQTHTPTRRAGKITAMEATGRTGANKNEQAQHDAQIQLIGF